MTDYLYGTDIDDEYLHSDPHDAIAYRGECLVHDDPLLPWEGWVNRWTITPPGDSGNGRIPDGAQIVEDIVERFGDECGYEDLYENYESASVAPDVIAAFQAARDLLVSKQRFRIADRLDARASYVITAVAEDGELTYTLGEWTQL